MSAVTVPRGDIFLEYGSGAPLVITCVLDPDDDMVRRLSPPSGRDDGAAGNGTDAAWRRPSDRIVFFKDDNRVPELYVSVLNATAAQLGIPNPPAGRALFSCMLRLNDPPLQRPRSSNRSDATARRVSAGDRQDGGGDATTAAIYSTAQPTSLETSGPTSLETSGPPPLPSGERMAGVCMNTVFVGCEYIAYQALPCKSGVLGPYNGPRVSFSPAINRNLAVAPRGFQISGADICRSVIPPSILLILLSINGKIS